MNNFESNDTYFLVIESSVSGGSLSLMQKYKEIDFWEGSGTVSKAEDILEAISGLLGNNSINKSQIKQIVVSKGPGSFTGTRIGLAIGLGLQKSLGCDIYGLSVLEAVGYQFKGKNNIIAAIPVGNKQVCFQSFGIAKNNKLLKLTPPNLLFFDSFIQFMRTKSDTTFILYKKLYENVLESTHYKFDFAKRINCSQMNLTHLVGKYFIDGGASDNAQPIYALNLEQQKLK